jgi:hypothetical protein
MSTKTMKQIDDLVGRDEQLALIIQLQTLAYTINQGGIAEAQVEHKPHFLHVVVRKPGFGGEELLNAALGIAMPSDTGWPVMRLAADMRKAVARMEQILAEGNHPAGTAA